MKRLGLVLLLLVSACGKPARSSTADAVKAKNVKPPEAAAQPAGEKSSLTEEQKRLPVAKVDDITITLGDFEERLLTQPSYARMRYSTLDKKREFLQNMIQFEALAMEARKLGLDKDPEVIYAMKQQMVKKLIKSEVEDKITVSDVTDEEVLAYYNANLTQYQKPEQVRVSHVLFASRDDAEKAHGEIVAVTTQDPRKTRQAFSEMARSRSADSETKDAGGDLGFFSREAAEEGKKLPDPAVVEAAFKIEKVGEVSGVVKGADGFHILLLANKRPKVDKSVEEVKRQIQNKLFRDKKTKSKDDYVAAVKAKAKVEVIDSNLDLVKLPEGPMLSPVERLTPDLLTPSSPALVKPQLLQKTPVPHSLSAEERQKLVNEGPK